MPQPFKAPDGTVFNFPDDATPAEMQKAIFDYGQAQSGVAQNKAQASGDILQRVLTGANPWGVPTAPDASSSDSPEAMGSRLRDLAIMVAGGELPAIAGKIGGAISTIGDLAGTASKIKNPTWATAAKGAKYVGGKLTPAIAEPEAVQGAEMYRTPYGGANTAPLPPVPTGPKPLGSVEMPYRMGSSPVSSASEPSINGLQPQTPMQSWRAANPNGEGRMTGQFTEGAGGLGDLAANKVAPTPYNPAPEMTLFEGAANVRPGEFAPSSQTVEGPAGWNTPNLPGSLQGLKTSNVPPLASTPHPWFSGIPNGVDLQDLEPGNLDALADAGLPDFKKSPQGLRASTARLNNNYLDALNDPNK